MKNNKESTSQTPKDLLNDLHALVAEAEKMTSEAFSDQTGDAVSALRARFNTAQERFADFYADARKRVVTGAKYTNETIRANPYQAIAVAAGAGLLAGLLIGRRSNR